MAEVSNIVDGILTNNDMDKLNRLYTDVNNKVGLDGFLIDNLKGLLLGSSVTKKDIKQFYENNLAQLSSNSPGGSVGLNTKEKLKDEISTTNRYIMYNMSDTDFYKKSIRILKVLLVILGVACIYVLIMGSPKMPSSPFNSSGPKVLTSPGVIGAGPVASVGPGS